MRKIYTTLGAVLVSVTSLLAQAPVKGKVTMPAKSIHEHQMKFDGNDRALFPHEPTVVPDRATILLANQSFESATLPVGWSTVDNGGTNNLTVFNNPTYAHTGSRSMLLDGGTAGLGCDDDLITPVVNCASATHPYISFWINMYGPSYNAAALNTNDFKVFVSTDGGTTYGATPVYTDAMMTSIPSGREYVNIRVNLSSVAAGQANVKVKIKLLNVGSNYYYQFLDDVMMWDNPNYELSIGSTFAYSDIGPFFRIPLSQNDSISFYSDIYNTGNNGQVFSYTPTIGSFSNTVVASFTAGQNDTLNGAFTVSPPAAKFKAPGVNSYTVTNTVVGDPAEDDPANNVKTQKFEITNDQFARENGFPNSQTFGILKTGASSATYRAQCPYQIGNLYRINTNTQALSVSFAVSNITTLSVSGALLRVRLKEATTGWPDVAGSTSAILTFTNTAPAQRPTAINPINNYITINFPAPINLTAGKTYVAIVERVVNTASDSTKYCHILTADNNINQNKLVNDDYGTVIWAVDMGTGLYDALPYSLGDEQAVIRLNVTNPCTATITAATTVTQPSCGLNNGSIVATGVTGGSSPYVYSWSRVAGTASTALSSGTATSVTGLAPGTYGLIVNDANGCSSTIATYSLVNTGAPSTLTSGAATANPTSCGGTGTVEVSVSAGAAIASVNWTKGGTGVGTTNPLSGAGITAGSYVASVTNTAGCISTFSVTITDPVTFTSTYTATSVKCKGDANGSVTINVTPAGAYSYSFGGGPAGTNNSFTGIPAGTYTFNVLQGGCTGSGSAVVVEPATTFSAGSVSKIDINCFGELKGQLSVSGASGGGTPYTYAWSGTATGSNTTGTVTGLGAGTYTVVVTDANGCVKNPSGSPVTITQPAAALTMSKTASTTKQATFAVSGGTPPYVFSLVSGPGTITGSTTLAAPGNKVLNFTIGGTYDVKVTDSKGCFKTLTAVDVPTSIQDIEGVSAIGIYPNPTSDDVTIHFNVTEAKTLTVKMVGINGQEVYSQELTQFVGDYKKTISLSDNARGVYFLQIISDKNVVTKKVVKL